MILPRHAPLLPRCGEPFDGKRRWRSELANFAVPKERLREETSASRTANEAQSRVVRDTKEAMRTVRGMSDDQARISALQAGCADAAATREIRDRSA